MATVLVAWELGGGLGHLARLRPIVHGLARRGHRVFAVAKDVVRASRMFRAANVSVLPAPTVMTPSHKRVRLMRTFAHVLHNTGCGDADTLQSQLHSWRGLFDRIRPDLTLFDHSPTAMLASRDYTTARACLGTGFCCPALETPFRSLRRAGCVDDEQLERDESQLLEIVNSTLDAMQMKRLERLSSLYAEMDETILATFPELDHYPDRPAGDYWGTWAGAEGREPEWPQGRGKRVFVYLRPCPAFPSLLNKLERCGCSTIVFAKGLSPSLRRRLETPSTSFVSEPLDLTRVGGSCDLAILNGGHGATATMLLAGVPILQIPCYLEQSMTARAVHRLRAGVAADARDSQGVERALESLLANEDYAIGARRFASTHASHCVQETTTRVVDLCQDYLPRGLASKSRRGAPRQLSG